MIHVLLIDDHAVVRTGYRTLLSDAAGIAGVTEASSGDAGFQSFLRDRPDVTVIDLNLPGISGLEIIRRMVAREGDARILAFSMHEDTIFVEKALQAGARGYVTKSSAADVLVEAVRKVAAGGVYLDPEVASRLAYQHSRSGASPFASLSTREFEIMTLLANGTTIEDISQRLSLSYKTVANYSTQIKRKVGASSAVDLTRLAIRHGVMSA